MSRSTVSSAVVALFFVVAFPDDVTAQAARRYVDPRTAATFEVQGIAVKR